MKYLAMLILLLVVASPLWGSTAFFYGGDLDLSDPNQNGLANETDAIVGGNPYGAATYQNFVTSSVVVSGLFTNDLMSDSLMVPATAKSVPTAYWEIRSGVSEGNGGTLIASGTGFDNVTRTGRSDFGYNEYRNQVGGLSVSLASGTYWFAVVPQAVNNSPGRSFNSDTDGLNGIGTQIDNQQFWNSAFFGANFTNANNEGAFRTFSSGALTPCREGEACSLGGLADVPEPSALMLVCSGLMGVAAVARRRCFLK